MDFHEMSRQLADALVDQLEVIDNRQAEQRQRWFRVEDDKHVEIREVYSIAGHEKEVPVCGIEKPSRLDIKSIRVKVNGDLSEEKQNGVMRMVTRLFSGRDDKSSEIEITVELMRGEPSEGLMAIHKRAANEIKDFVNTIDLVVEGKQEEE